MTSPSGRTAPSSDLAERWQAAARDWAQWWTGARVADVPTTHSAVRVPPTAAVTATTGTQAELIAALNKKYRERWEALWSAAVNALAQNPTDAGAIPIVADAAPGGK